MTECECASGYCRFWGGGRREVGGGSLMMEEDEAMTVRERESE